MSVAQETTDYTKVAVLTCMDGRLDPAKALSLEEGDAHVIRNAGGRASGALRSITISQQLLGTRENRDTLYCGMVTFSDGQLRKLVLTKLGQDADHIAFLRFRDLRQSVLDDVKILKVSPLVLDVPVTGFVYEIESGRVVRV